MYFSNDILIHAVILVLAVCGFFVARHIYKHKNNAKAPLVCPVGFDCDFVVHSDYSEFMHIQLEIFGMIYYALLFFCYLYLLIFSEIIPPMFSSVLFFGSVGAFLFSLYLAGVQIFIIKKGCSWCVISALISTAIFILVAFNYDFSIITHFIK